MKKIYFIMKEVYISDMKIYTTRLYIESNLTYQVEVNEFFCSTGKFHLVSFIMSHPVLITLVGNIKRN